MSKIDTEKTIAHIELAKEHAKEFNHGIRRIHPEMITPASYAALVREIINHSEIMIEVMDIVMDTLRQGDVSSRDDPEEVGHG